MSQCSNLGIRSGLEDLGAATIQYGQEHSGLCWIEGDSTAFEEDNSRIAVVKSGMNKRCADGARRVSTSTLQGVCDKDHVVLAETCTDRRDVIGDGKTRIKNEIEITSRCGRNQVTISDKRSRVVVIIQSWHYYYYYVVISFYCCSVFQYSLYFHVCIVFFSF